MSGRLVIITIVLILMAAMSIFFVEFFIPLSANFQFKAECRKILLEMEEKNELTTPMRSYLQSTLTEKGFNVISISNPHNARRGENLNLKVVADYEYSKLTGIFKREDMTERMEFDKYTVARKVLN